MDSRRTKTRIFDENIAQITEIYNDKNNEIQKYRNKIKEIENEMNRNYVQTYDALSQCGQSLSTINDILYHSNIENLFVSKGDPKYVQTKIEEETKKALISMGIKNEDAQKKIDKKRLEIYYKELPAKNKNKNKNHEAMDIDNIENEDLTPKQKENKKLMLEIKEINEEIEKLDVEYDQFHQEYVNTETEIKNDENFITSQEQQIWNLYPKKETTAELINIINKTELEQQMRWIRDNAINNGHQFFEQFNEYKQDWPDNKLLDFLEEPKTVKILKDTFKNLKTKFHQFQHILSQMTYHHLAKEYEANNQSQK